MALRGRIRGNGHKLNYREFHLNIMFSAVRVVRHGNKLPREAVKSSSSVF